MGFKKLVKKFITIKDNATKYGYDEIKFKTTKIPVKIMCFACCAHFMQRPEKHLIGHGCPNCNGGKPMFTKEQFIENVRIKFEARNRLDEFNHFDFTDLIYLGTEYEITVLCTRCDQYFIKRANSLLEVRGCSNCNGGRRVI